MVVPIRIVHTANVRNLAHFFNIVVFDFCLVQNQKNDRFIWEIFRGGVGICVCDGDCIHQNRTVILSGFERGCRVTSEWRNLVLTEGTLISGRCWWEG